MREALRAQNHILFIGTSLIYAGLTYALTYHLSSLGTSDFGAHAELVLNLWKGDSFSSFFQSVSYPGWHAIFYLLTNAGISHLVSISLATALFNFLTAVVVFYGIYFLLEKRASLGISLLLGTVVLFVTAIFLPPYSPEVYSGHGSPTVWHNPTYIAVKAVGLLTALIFFSVLKKRTARAQTMVLIGLLVFASLLLKPSFLQFFLPAVFLYLVIDYCWNRDLRFVRNILLALAPALLLLGYQFFSTFYSSPALGDGGIALTFFGHSRQTTAFFPLSVLLLLAFPLFAAVVCRKDIFKKNSPYVPFALMLAVAFCEFSFLIETGARATHGNFAWGYFLAVFIAWVLLLPLFVKKAFVEKSLGKPVAVLGVALVALHFASGIYYYLHLLFGTAMF